MPRREHTEPEVHRITGAQRPHSDDLGERMGRYLFSMLVRTLCIILVLVIHHPVRWVFAVGAVILPYIAVVMANAGRGRRDSGPAPVAPASRTRLTATPSRPVPGGPDGQDDGEVLEGQVVTPVVTPEDRASVADEDHPHVHRTVA